jgi:hypothetical protein
MRQARAAVRSSALGVTGGLVQRAEVLFSSALVYGVRRIV